MGHGKVDVEHPDELWVSLDDFPDALAREGLLPESRLDLVEHLLVTRLGLVKDCIISVCRVLSQPRQKGLTVLEGLVRRTQSVAEVLGKDPSDVGVGGFLNSMRSVLALVGGELMVSFGRIKRDS